MNSRLRMILTRSPRSYDYKTIAKNVCYTVSRGLFTYSGLALFWLVTVPAIALIAISYLLFLTDDARYKLDRWTT